jgi:transposase
VFIRKTTKKDKNRTYTNYVLVESVRTEKGPRQKSVCSLGSLKPRPKEEWLSLARRIQDALIGQMRIEGFGDEVEAIVQKVESKRKKGVKPRRNLQEIEEEIVSVNPKKIKVEKPREAGHLHVGIHFWRKVGLDSILETAGLSKKSRILSLAMTMNRLIFPSSELAMPGWVNRTALGDLVGVDFSGLNEDSLYRNMDKLHAQRGFIERCLSEKETALFNLDNTIYLYDLTSTYFEGQCKLNPKAKRGYSRDKRPDCKQVVIGLVVNRDGFPKAHEVFDGNRQDQTTVDEMLDVLESRVGREKSGTVVVDRGMAHEANMEEIKSRGYHYIVASRQVERDEWIDEFEGGEGWEEVIRKPSPRNPCQKKARITVKKKVRGEETYVLCRSEGRHEKDKAIWQNKEKRLLSDLKKLGSRIQKGRLKKEKKIYEAIGRLKERYPTQCRYYEISYDTESRELFWGISSEDKAKLKKLQGCYILKTNRKDMSADEIWRIYSLLTRAESAFRAMKSPLCERPIFHQLQHRVETHIFLCILAYHLLVAIEKTLIDKGIHTSWATVREVLSTHEVVTIILPTSGGDIIKIRRGTEPEPEHLEIYKNLELPFELMKPRKLVGDTGV